jgi:hypothetical protein
MALPCMRLSGGNADRAVGDVRNIQSKQCVPDQVANLCCGESYPGVLEVSNLVDRDDVWGLAKDAFQDAGVRARVSADLVLVDYVPVVLVVVVGEGPPRKSQR